MVEAATTLKEPAPQSNLWVITGVTGSIYLVMRYHKRDYGTSGADSAIVGAIP